MINDDENVALCALNKIFGYHPRLALSLMEAAGSAAAVFSGEKPCLPGYPELAAQLNASTLDWAAAEIKSVTEKGFRFCQLPPGFRIGQPAQSVQVIRYGLADNIFDETKAAVIVRRFRFFPVV